MGKLKNIEWRNIYYFLCYAVDELQYFVPKDINYENIQGTHDLLAELLCNSFEVVYSNGYLKEYRREEIVTDKPYGSIDIVKSTQTGNFGQGKLVCQVDTLDTNNELNQIVKSAFTVLIDSNKVVNDKINPKLMTKLINYRRVLDDVDNISITREILNKYRDIPEWYKPIIVVAKFILEEWLALDKTGTKRLLYLDDDNRLGWLWQKFLDRFYQKEMPEYKVDHPNLGRQGSRKLLPDIVLVNTKSNKALVTDAKWYETLENISSNANFNQIYVYTDKYFEQYKTVTTGILLYAQSESFMHDIEHEENFDIISYEIGVNKDFELIKQELKDIANRFLQ
ncbi:MAG: hypothetical protein J6A59_08555 [Lachnospiraceae bacterium]|nr:hypothetical protein [Lachnospiraceae bacterium]